MKRLHITVAVNDEARVGFEPEHGLSLILRTDVDCWLFDTGAGRTTMDHVTRLGGNLSETRGVFLSHGHYDHTGGIAALCAANDALEFWHAPGIETVRYNLDPAGTRDISMPPNCRRAFEAIPPEKRHEVGCFTAIAPDLALTGPIARRTNETVGGPFFLDVAGTRPDPIADEQALVLTLARGETKENVLITGCCHAGIINTLQGCAENGRPIHTVVGGLHLGKASPERLTATVDYLNRSAVTRLILLHCTGAFEEWAWRFRGQTRRVAAGERFDL